MSGDDRGGGGPALSNHVEEQFDRRPDRDGTGEHSVRRPHRFVRESFCRSHNRLGDHLGALHHLPAVLAGEAGVAGEPVGPVGLYVEQIEQAANRPLGLIRFCRQHTYLSLPELTAQRDTLRIACKARPPGAPR